MAAYLTSLPDSRACGPKRSKARSVDRRPTSAFSWSLRVSHAEKGGRSAFRRRLRLFGCSILASRAFAILHLMFLWGPEIPACGGILWLRQTIYQQARLGSTDREIRAWRWWRNFSVPSRAPRVHSCFLPFLASSPIYWKMAVVDETRGSCAAVDPFIDLWH